MQNKSDIVNQQAALVSQILLKNSQLGSIPVANVSLQNHHHLHHNATTLHPISIQFMNGNVNPTTTATGLNGNDINFF
jgi:hypothetical protein